MINDIDSRFENAVPGYPRLAEEIGPYSHYKIWRSFRALGTRLLFYRQARVAELFEKLTEIERADYESTDGDKNKYSTDCSYLKNSESDTDHEQLKMIELVEKEYDELS